MVALIGRSGLLIRESTEVEGWEKEEVEREEGSDVAYCFVWGEGDTPANS